MRHAARWRVRGCALHCCRSVASASWSARTPLPTPERPLLPDPGRIAGAMTAARDGTAAPVTPLHTAVLRLLQAATISARQTARAQFPLRPSAVLSLGPGGPLVVGHGAPAAPGHCNAAGQRGQAAALQLEATWLQAGQAPPPQSLRLLTGSLATPRRAFGPRRWARGAAAGCSATWREEARRHLKRARGLAVFEESKRCVT